MSTGTTWIVTTIAGRAGYFGDNDGLGTNALLNFPFALASDSAGNIYVTDGGNWVDPRHLHQRRCHHPGW